MRDILQKRAEELAQRMRVKEPDSREFFLVSEWSDSNWAFPPGKFLSVVAGPHIDAPYGTRYRGQLCSGFLRYESRILPVFDWARIVGVEESADSLFLVSLHVEFALKISSVCGLQRLSLATSSAGVGGPGLQAQWDDVKLADLGVLF